MFLVSCTCVISLLPYRQNTSQNTSGIRSHPYKVFFTTNFDEKRQLFQSFFESFFDLLFAYCIWLDLVWFHLIWFDFTWFGLISLGLVFTSPRRLCCFYCLKKNSPHAVISGTIYCHEVYCQKVPLQLQIIVKIKIIRTR